VRLGPGRKLNPIDHRRGMIGGEDLGTLVDNRLSFRHRSILC
jgi:hypothetical protein